MYIRAKDCLKEIYLFVDLGRFAVDSKNPPPTHTHKALWLEGREQWERREAETLLCMLCGFLWVLDSLWEEEGIRSPAGRHDFQIPILASEDSK